MKWLLVAVLLLVAIAAGYYFYPRAPLPSGIKVTRIVVWKAQRKMMVYAGDTLLKTYNISLGHQPVGDKHFEWDNKTPEGIYTIYGKNAHSTCHKNLGISYPDSAHRQQAHNAGRSPGGDIKIHGLPNKAFNWRHFHLLKDWTNGCIGITNQEIDELYEAVPVGTPIDIKP